MEELKRVHRNISSNDQEFFFCVSILGCFCLPFLREGLWEKVKLLKTNPQQVSTDCCPPPQAFQMILLQLSYFVSMDKRRENVNEQ